MKQLAVEAKVLWDTQRRRVVSLGVLALAFAGMFGRNVLLPGIRGAMADTPPKERAGGPAQDSPAESLQVSARPTIRLAAPPPLTRDMFAFDRTRFPLPTPEVAGAQNMPKSDGVPAEGNHGQAEPTREQIEAAVRAEAGALQLRSLVLGAAPLAVIEEGKGNARGRHVVAPGESVAGFVLVAVRAASVVLVKQDVEVELYMATGD